MKKRNLAIVALLLVVTNLITLGLSGKLRILANDKITISVNEYDKMKQQSLEYARLTKLKEYVSKYYLRDVDSETLTTGQFKGVVASLEDPYSSYLTSEEYEALIEETEGVFYGIGVIVSAGQDSYITVVSPIDDTPAFQAGIKTGDRILKVNGLEYFSDTMEQAVKEIRGDKGTEVTLTIQRQKGDELEVFDVVVLRDEIKVDTVSSEILSNQIGYIRISQFDETTDGDFNLALKDLETSNIKGLIVDLRNNPGGLLDVCVNVTDEFLSDGTIVTTKDKNGKENGKFSATSKSSDLPLAILINGGSASASEIMAGALKDYKRATLIGTTTFGKGVVQKIVRFPEGDGIKLTVSEYFTPNGENIHGIGITPNIEVEMPEDYEGMGPEYIKQDTQLQRAIEELSQK